MKLQIVVVTLIVAIIATMVSAQQPDHAFALLNAVSPGEFTVHQALTPNAEEGLVRNKRQYGYGGYGGGYGRGFGGGGYGGRYGGYGGRGFGGGYGGYGGGFGGGGFGYGR